MKKFIEDILLTAIVSLVAVPMTFISMGLAGYIWSKIEKKLKVDND